MVDVRGPATLRGFPVSVADIGDQMHLCHPLLSFKGDPDLYLAHRLEWQDDPDALAIVDPDEASTLGVLLPSSLRQPISSGEGVIAVGARFVQAAEVAKVELLSTEIGFVPIHDSYTQEANPTHSLGCWIGVATPAVYAALRNRLAEKARGTFDEALGDAAFRGGRLSDQGDAALLLMRKSGPGRRDDLAIRQLAGARQNGDPDLSRRLLIRFSLELAVQERFLDERVERYIANVANRSASVIRERQRYLSTLELHAREQARERSAQQTLVEMKTTRKAMTYIISLLSESESVDPTHHIQTKYFLSSIPRSDYRIQSRKPFASSNQIPKPSKMLSKPAAEAL